MKISRHKDGSRATEITSDADDNSQVGLHGDAIITTTNSTTGEKSTVAQVSQHGEWDFTQRPRVADQEIALRSETGIDTATKNQTIVDNVSTVVVLCPVQHVVNVLYSIKNAGCNEKGVMTISDLDGDYFVAREQHAKDGHFSEIEFSATESNGSLLLNVIGHGTGLITDLQYRVNSVNTLYL